jgi:hypothetical protein
VDPEQEQALLAALDEYWAVISNAWRDLDPSQLPEVLIEPRLSQMRQLLDQERAQGRAAKIDVERGYRHVQDVRDDEAVVYEDYLNRSLEIDLATGAPVATVTPKQFAAAYLFRKTIAGQWKVAEVATYAPPN